MKKNWMYRFLMMMAVLVVSAYMVIPTFFNLDEKSSYPHSNKINLGLDLQGGLYIVLGIDFNKVYADEVGTQAQNIVSFLRDQHQIQASVGRIDKTNLSDPKVTINFLSSADASKAKPIVRENYDYYLRMTGSSGSDVVYGVNNSLKNELEKTAIDKSIEVIRNRIDEFGVTEPEIISQGSDRVVVQLPGVKDIERAKELIGKTAKLEFKMVDENVTEGSIISWMEKLKTSKLEYKKGSRFSQYVDQANEILKNDLPQGSMISFEKRVNSVTNEVTVGQPYIVKNVADLTGDDLQDARVSVGQRNEPLVSFSLKTRGAKKFGELTTENIGKRFAIILDGNVYSAPSIQGAILGGNAQITLGAGNYEQKMKEASDLALVLRAGALPVELEFQEQRIVGPSLGADSIAKSKFAGIVGCGLVFLFILFYYKISGAIAVFTLALNVLFVLACLVGLEATLTLPGIAGIALTVGMAVDANIIIFERIKEEIAAGASGRAAVESGFAKAFWTIIDANLTTAVAGLALINFGTGPIRGFAVTLLIGIIATVYCSYFVGKLLFEYYMDKVQGKSVSI